MATQKNNEAKIAAAVKKSAPARKKPASDAKAASGAVAEQNNAELQPGNPSAVAKVKSKKPKMVRHSISMPENEFQALGEIKRACQKAGVEVKKRELLRAGVQLIQQMEVEQLKSVLAALAPLKTVRSKKEK